MKKTFFILSLFLFFGNFLFAQTWDILDKSMAAYNQNDGASTNQAWAVAQGSSAGSVATQQTGYVNFTKTNTGSTARWAWVRPATALVDLTTGTPYSIEVKVRVNPIGIADNATYFEANQISLRLGSKNTAARIYLRYGDGVTGGSISTTSGGSNAYAVNTSVWQVYRLVFHADHLKYDVYIAGVEGPIFENIAISTTGDQNGVYFGAESYHRCNMDIEYVKMGTGDFYSKPQISSIALSHDSHIIGNESTVSVTANTTLINNGEKLLFSLVDGANNEIVTPIEAMVTDNVATADIVIPSTVSKGEYFVKVAVSNGKIGDIDISSKKAAYRICSSFYVGKNLVTFGNSITSAANSWAYQTYSKLGFGNLYNGAVAGACWYKRARLAQNGDSIWTQNYDDPKFAGMSNETNSDPEAYQRIINNCAVVHIQKYLIDNPTANPDFAILSYGTNDAASTATMGNVEQTMAKELNEVDLFTMAGALRWSIETLRTRFPKLIIYVALPIQAQSTTKNSDNVKKIQVITGICDALSVTYFDCFNESGITVENAVEYLRDGLHPNEAGQDIHGDYIVRKLEDVNEVSTSITPKEVSKEFISISDNVLKSGKSLFIKSLMDNAPLSEVALYGLAGNKICRKSISGNEITFNVPAVSGMYILSVRLNNNTSKEFKILVK